MAYAVVAVVSVIAAGAYSTFTVPASVEGFSLVGNEFYPDFKDPRSATSLRLAAFDAESAKQNVFMIEQKDGEWVIPSHFDYPADARERLNKTGNSVIGIKRGPQKATRESEHKDLGVLDPMEEEITEFEGRGKRITMKDAKGDVLVDYIIGKKFKDDGELYYVRAPGENEVYLAEVDVDVSTKFSDWIKDDLLELNGGDLRELTVNKFSVDERRGTITGQEVNILKRDKSFDPWTLDGLKEETEELKKTEIDGMVTALDDLKILAVRPKPEGLNPDLTVKPGMSQGLARFLEVELRSKGFFISGGEKARLLANEGNLQAATDAGVVYTLNFGEIFSGSEEEIQFGSDKTKDAESGDEEAKEGEEAVAEPVDDTKQSRYLFVTAAFDPKYLGDKPTKPEEPKRPEGLKDDEEAKEADGEKKEDDEAQADAGSKSKEEDEAAQKAAEEQTKLKAEWQAAQSKYKSDLRTYETDVKDYEKKIADGKKKVDDLNHRFGAWYYVISGGSFETLRLARADLVKPKEQEKPEEAKQPAPNLPDAGGKQPEPAKAAGGEPKGDKPEEPKAAKPSDPKGTENEPVAKSKPAGAPKNSAGEPKQPEPKKPDNAAKDNAAKDNAAKDNAAKDNGKKGDGKTPAKPAEAARTEPAPSKAEDKPAKSEPAKKDDPPKKQEDGKEKE